MKESSLDDLILSLKSIERNSKNPDDFNDPLPNEIFDLFNNPQ